MVFQEWLRLSGQALRLLWIVADTDPRASDIFRKTRGSAWVQGQAGSDLRNTTKSFTGEVRGICAGEGNNMHVPRRKATQVEVDGASNWVWLVLGAHLTQGGVRLTLDQC
jgi:hypothetical protein